MSRAEPVLVGGGQAVLREVDPAAPVSPVELMARAARAAADDAGPGARLLERVDAVGVVDVPGWRPRNAPRLVAERLGFRARHEWVTALGGESPLLLLRRAARAVAEGRTRVALLVGSNNVRTLLACRRAGQRAHFETGGEGEPERLGVDRAGSSECENAYGLATPPVVYPLFENALRARRGLDLATHRARMGALMSPMTRVAARNPFAWFPTERSPTELVTPGPDNRMIAFPYPKYLNAVLETDQSAAVILCAAEAARELGIRADRHVSVWGTGSAVEAAWFPTERPRFDACDALRTAAAGALAEAGTRLEELAALDLYSCFPVAVAMACEMLGLQEDDPRGLTVAGGLPYFGGPGNDYALHALVSLAERLRAEPGARGLVTGNGWYLTKHSACVLASAPRAAGPPPAETPAFAPAGPPVAPVETADGSARIETYTVVYARDGRPERGIVVGRLDDGSRFLAHTPDDPALLEDLVSREGVGRSGRVAHDGTRNVFRPD